MFSVPLGRLLFCFSMMDQVKSLNLENQDIAVWFRLVIRICQIRAKAFMLVDILQSSLSMRSEKYYQLFCIRTHLKHNGYKNGSKGPAFCDRRKFKQLNMASMIRYG